MSISLQFGTTASQTSIQRFSLQCLSLYSGVALYCTVPASSPPQLLIYHCQKSWSLDPWRLHLLGTAGEDWLVAVRLFCRSCAQAGMFCHVPLPPPTAVRPPHRTGKEACCIYLNTAVKQPSVCSLPFKNRKFHSSGRCGKKPLVRASPNKVGLHLKYYR